MSRQLHIVALDIPWPPDYGGAIDMFYRMEALWKAGIRIHLHYFNYNNRGNPNELNKYCESICVYERKTGHRGFSFRLPYIVASRMNSELLENLNKDQYPILLEGVHCSGILQGLKRAQRKVLVRLHNDESEYYRQLAGNTYRPLRKVYFANESRLLRKYERGLPNDCGYACITQKDVSEFKKVHHSASVHFLPAFTPYNDVNGEEGLGNFCLYHGNLSVPENEKAAAWLLTHVCPQLKIPLIVAGKSPSKRLDKLAHFCQHTCLVADPTSTEINELVRKAHINILPSFSTTGIKIKLLHALFEGRHCIVNDAMVAGTGLESACHSGTNARAIASIIAQLRNQPFTNEEKILRRRLLGDTYDNDKNARQLIQYLW